MSEMTIIPDLYLEGDEFLNNKAKLPHAPGRT